MNARDIGALLARRMLQRADEDKLPETHPVRITATELNKVFSSHVQRGEIDVSELAIKHSAAREVWRCYSGEVDQWKD